MVAAVVLLIFFNIVVWLVELLNPYHNPDARTKRSGLLLLVYLPLWAIVSNVLLALAYPLLEHRSYFQHGRSAVTAVWVSLFLALVFALLHRPLLSLLGRYILRGKQGLWGPASAGFGAVAGLLQYLIVRTHVPVGPTALVIFCATSSLVGYCVGYIRSIKPKHVATQ